MAINPIRAVIFDMGGTLEDVTYDDTIIREATRGLRGFLRGLDLDPGLNLLELQATVLSGMKAYRTWREKHEIELSPEQVWVEYIFPDRGLVPERLRAAADEITFFYETHYRARSLRPEAPVVLEALRRQGFELAIISNVLSRQLVERKLLEYGISHYFDLAVTSSNFGWRKPNVRIFEEAIRLMQLPPEACAYVGDTVSRDVIGARSAGYGLVIQLKSFLTDEADRGAADVQPDAVIQNLGQVLDLVSAPMEFVHDH